ncbi:MAG: FtsH protease activity modulator HflK [Phycisphaerae bacterium]
MAKQEFDQAIDELKFYFRRYRRLIVVIAIGVVVLVGLDTTFYKVEADEQGVVLRFGRLARLTEPGLHTKLPWPIETVQQVPVAKVQKLEFGFVTAQPGRRTMYERPTATSKDVARMLTGDLNLAHVEWIVRYKINDAAKYLFAIGGARSQRVAVEDTIRDASETVMRRLVGDVSVDTVLTTGRDQIATDGKRELQEFLNNFDCGVTVVAVKLQTVSPPDLVKDAFDAVNRARQNKERVVNNSLGERNRRIPEARGKRDRAIAEAEGYMDRVVKAGTGRANAFLSKLEEYKKAPEVTRLRLYLEAMEDVLSKVDDIIIIDQSVRGVLPLLDLDRTGALVKGAKGGGR